MTPYEQFIANKKKAVVPVGPTIEAGDVHPLLHDWQARIVEWSVRQGRAAIFADCGLGKTFMQLEWARLIADTTLIVAPLSVARQTVREARKLDQNVRYVRHADEVDGPGVWITNYEMVDEFDPDQFGAVVLDESSILKNVEGRTRRRLTEGFATVPYRLACTATPAPNDVAELCNHAEFLGAMPRNEMLAAFFVHDEIGWRPKGHASGPMFEWMATWSVALRRPSDIGYDDEGYDLPPLSIIAESVDVDIEAEGQLFPTELGGIGGRSKVRRSTLDARCERAAQLCNNNTDQWIVWCGLNDEAATVAKSIDGAVNVEGSWDPDDKAEAIEAFQDGSIRVLVTKTSIAGFGMNFQNAHKMAFVGLSDSYESYYQAIRRCWRFGQQHPVDAHVIVSALEQQIVENIRRKETEAAVVTSQLVHYSPLRKGETDDRSSALHHRRIPRRMLASTTRR
jgi:superfamily II DNA or RNA helicase